MLAIEYKATTSDGRHMVALLVRDEIQGEGGTVKPKWTLSLKLPDNIKLWPQLVVDDGTAPFLETGLFCGTEHVQVHGSCSPLHVPGSSSRSSHY